MDQHELRRWLERHDDELMASGVSTAVGRGPALGPQPGSVWISFQSKAALGRVVLSPDGHCTFAATTTADGRSRFQESEEFTSSSRLDDALAELVGHLA